MGPNWAEVVQAVATAGGLAAVWWQVRQATTTIQSNTNAQLLSGSLAILRFLAEHPGNYDYFYFGKSAPDRPEETLRCITEMFVNYMEHVAQQVETMPKSERENWRKFVKETYARSPIIQQHLRDFEKWYDKRLLQLVDGVVPLKPSEIRG